MSVKQKNKKVLEKRIYRGDRAIRNFVAGNRIMEQCLDSILNILRKEKYKGKSCPFNTEIALNLDKVEVVAKKGTLRNPTVDFVVCLEKDWLLMVEAKLDVDRVENIEKEIYGKIAHSKDILQSCDNYCHAEEVVIVLLKDKNYQERYNRLRRLLVAKNRDIRPCRVRDFYDAYFVA